MSDHSFNPFIAQTYSVNIAIFINTMIFWTRTNAGKNENFYDGRYWTFGTPKFYAKYFPYFKPRLIKDIIQNCLDYGLILKGNYNKKGYDRTNWYALSDKALDELRLDITCLQPAPGLIGRKTSNPLYEKRTMHCTDYVSPIPDTKPDTKQDNKITYVDFEKSTEIDHTENDKSDEVTKSDYLNNLPKHKKGECNPIENNRKSVKSDYSYYQVNKSTERPPSNILDKKPYKEDAAFMSFYNQYPNKQKPRVAYRAFLKLRPNAQLLKEINSDVQKRMANNWKGRHQSKIPHPATYLNSREWESELYPPEITQSKSNKPPRYTMDELMDGAL